MLACLPAWRMGGTALAGGKFVLPAICRSAAPARGRRSGAPDRRLAATHSQIIASAAPSRCRCRGRRPVAQPDLPQPGDQATLASAKRLRLAQALPAGTTRSTAGSSRNGIDARAKLPHMDIRVAIDCEGPAARAGQQARCTAAKPTGPPCEAARSLRDEVEHQRVLSTRLPTWRGWSTAQGEIGARPAAVNTRRAAAASAHAAGRRGTRCWWPQAPLLLAECGTPAPRRAMPAQRHCARRSWQAESRHG